MMKYLLDLDSLEGTNAGRRIEQLKAMGDGATATYALKRNPREFNQSNDRYTAAQKELVAQKMKKWIHFFGYNEHEGNEKTSFFKYDEAQAKESEADYYGFRKTNEASLKKVVQDGGWKGPKYDVNCDKECFDLFPMDMVHKLQTPGRDFACKKLYNTAYDVKKDAQKK